MIEIVDDPESIWTIEKKQFFLNQSDGSFDVAGLVLGKKYNCYMTKLLIMKNQIVGVGTLNNLQAFNEFEINIALDTNAIGLRGYGKLLLTQLENDVIINLPFKIVATIKSSNLNREYIALWFYKQGYQVESLLKNEKEAFIKYCRSIFNRNDVTLVKHFNE